MKMNPYLSFKGDCEAAFKYYEQHLGGEMGDLFRYGGTPLAPRRIKPGVLQIAVEKAGWRPAQVTIEALPALVTDIAVVLEPLSSAPRTER